MRSSRNHEQKSFSENPFFLFAALSLPAAEEISYCQMLLSEAEQKVQGFDRQRKLYLPERAKRLSIMAVKDGSELLRKNKLSEAMAEFNRAWRFAPANPYSYWMAAIVRSMEAMQATRDKVKKQCFEDSLKLFTKAATIIESSPNRELKENLALDRAETLIQYGIFLKKEHPEQTERFFRQAEAILESIVPGRDARGKALADRIGEMRSRMSAAREKSVK